MRKIYTILLILFPFVMLGNSLDSLTQSIDSLKEIKITIGISASPDYCFRKLKPDDDSKWISDIRDTLEIAKLGYTVGANVEYKINKKIKVVSGILFSDCGERTKKYSLVSVPAGQDPIMYSYNFHYYYLNIPLKVDYYLLTRKLKFYVAAGISANVFLNQKVTSITTYGNSDTKVNSKVDPGFSRLNLAVSAGCGMRYPINKNTDLMIEPVYRRSVTSIIKAPGKGYLYSFGMNIGMFFNL